MLCLCSPDIYQDFQHLNAAAPVAERPFHTVYRLLDMPPWFAFGFGLRRLHCAVLFNYYTIRMA